MTALLTLAWMFTAALSVASVAAGWYRNDPDVLLLGLLGCTLTFLGVVVMAAVAVTP